MGRGFLKLAALVLLAAAAPEMRPEGAPGALTAKALAVIVNPRNPTTNVSFNELRSYLKLERGFWPDKTRCELLLRPSNSLEMEILFAKVYRMSSDELRKYWVGKVFRGEISAKPSVVPTVASACSRVQKILGALTVMLADEVPEGVRVLTIDGKKPGDEGYPLFREEEDGDRTASP